MTTQDEKQLLLRALTTTEKHVQETIQRICELRTRIAQTPVVVPEEYTASDHSLILGSLSAAKILALDALAGELREQCAEDSGDDLLKRFMEGRVDVEYAYEKAIVRWRTAEPKKETGEL